MSPAFEREEYAQRLARVQAQMAEHRLDALLIGDPANMNWLTGFDAWSFYVPQLVAVTFDRGPIWMGRGMDAGAARLTTYLDEDSIVTYPEDYVQRAGVHPMDFLAERLRAFGLSRKRLGYESDTYYFSPRALDALRSGLPEADFVDVDLLVNWVRAIKSEAEIAYMRDAALIADEAHRVAREGVRPGVRQCDLMGEILRCQVGGNAGFSGDMTALSPLILAGKAASTAHPMWSDETFENGQTVAFELGGTRHRYNAGLSRTVHLGRPPRVLTETASAVEEGLEAALDVLRDGCVAGEVHAAWKRVLDRHRLQKESRIGYAIGVGYPPDWGEHTVSLRAGEPTVIRTGMTIHVILGMWMADWGMELSETVLVGDTGTECLTSFPREVHLVD